MEEKKKSKLMWFLALLVLPIVLMVWASKFIWKQKWHKKYRIGAIIALWGILITYALISNNQYQQKQQVLSAQRQVQAKNEWHCTGPDGKRIGLSPQACEEFNNAWKNKLQENNQAVIISPTIEPTITQAINTQTANSTYKSNPISSNTPAPQNPPARTNSNDIYSVLKENAKQKWNTNYEMVQYEYENQVEAYNWVTAQSKYPEIMTKAKNKWGNNFEMVKYEYENQVTAFEWVNSQSEYPNIMNDAKNKWKDNYEMVQYEYENQVEAYKSL